MSVYNHDTSFTQAVIRKKNVINAVILRDMRTRFFNHGLGFIIVPLWPLAHMAILILIHTVAGHAAPYGDSAAVFFATGLVPTLTFSYISRFMGLSLLLNRPMLSFPEVHVVDVMLGRAFLEVIGAGITLFLMFILLFVTDQNPFPFDLEQAVLCYLSTIFLAVGCGALVGVATLFYPMVSTFYVLFVLLLYILSGIVFVASNLPDNISFFLSYNPLLVCVEWMRCAFYESYSDKLVSPAYVLSWGSGTFCVALVFERVFRRRLLDA